MRLKSNICIARHGICCPLAAYIVSLSVLSLVHSRFVDGQQFMIQFLSKFLAAAVLILVVVLVAVLVFWGKEKKAKKKSSGQ